MKRGLVILGIIGWLAFPMVCQRAYLDAKSHLGRKVTVLDEACKSLKPTEASVIWGEYKGLGSIAETWRTRYFLPFTGVWLLLGVGLAANMIKKKEHPTKT